MESMLKPLELWAGHECTVNRVGDAYSDQSIRGGHDGRLGDIDRFASLGITRLRYPLLWEKLGTDQTSAAWRNADEAVARLRELDVKIIAGLVHHGSGPPHTSLLANDFGKGLASHAARVAARYPGILDWTPVNEPLTTARFATLYGHWFPHARDEGLFWLALLNQIDATRYAMAAIRELTPEARLVQTEDLGRTFGRPATQQQADHDNERRWATWDLLTGQLVSGHPLYDRICAFGYGTRLDAIAREPCTPSIIGINHYLTSDRYLDERLVDYPSDLHGGNGRVAYADVAAARLPIGTQGGLAGAIADARARYDLPIALTEVHNGCTREEQMRWLDEAWSTAQRARREAANVVAVTAWSLLGAYDWTSLVTQQRGDYESGVWDLRAPTPRETAIAPMLRCLSRGLIPEHPVLGRKGWWISSAPLIRSGNSSPPILILGATGTLGSALGRACSERNLSYRLADRRMLPLNDRQAAVTLIDEIRPWAVINAAGWVRVDDAENDPGGCKAANTAGAVTIADLCAERDIHCTLFSSDLVFGGGQKQLYRESDAVKPLSIYGRSKADAEERIRASALPTLIIRTAAFFSPFDQHNFAFYVLDALGRNEHVVAAPNIVSPTYVPDLVRTVLDLVIDDERGLWHLSNAGSLSWHSFARNIADAAGYRKPAIEIGNPAMLGWRAQRPDFAALGSERGQLLPSLEDALARFTQAVPR